MPVRHRLLVFAAAAALAACEPAPPRQPLDAPSLQTQVRQLAGVAAEATLFTRELAAGHLNSAYAWVHQQSLASEAGRVGSSLAQPAPPSLQPQQRDALLLVWALQMDLMRVADAQRDPLELQSLGSRFTQVQRQAQALKGGR
jgi:hypothetical protein